MVTDDDFAPLPDSIDNTKAQRSGPSLKARAIALLARREHSRTELIKKLSIHCEDRAELECLLDDLQAAGWQSDTRYVQGLVHRKSGIQGSMRIVQALKSQGISKVHITEVKNGLKNTEFSRAAGVWEKRFSAAGPPKTPSDYAKQARFLSARGFSQEIVRKVLARCGEFDEVC